VVVVVAVVKNTIQKDCPSGQKKDYGDSTDKGGK